MSGSLSDSSNSSATSSRPKSTSSSRPDAERLKLGGHHLFRTALGRLDALASIGDGLTFEELAADSADRLIHGMTVAVLTLPALISSKEAANRPKDRAVLDLLRETLAQREEAADE